jgi:hypothetical protein
MVDDAALRGAVLPGVSATTPLDATARGQVATQLIERMLNSGATPLATQPDPAAVRTELDSLMGRLQQRGATTPTVLKAACAAVAGSAGMLVH